MTSPGSAESRPSRSARDARLLAGRALVVLVVLALASLPAQPAPGSEDPPGTAPSPGDDPEAAAVDPPAVDASGAALWDPAEQRLLMDHHAHTPRPMASLTKMLTALLAVETAGDLDEVVVASPEAAAIGQATVGLAPGQEVPLRSLVAGLMVESGNDAALAVAEHVAGNEAAFVDRMHERAAELGATSTRFLNASGLTNDPDHHASPVDLARIAAAAMDEPLVARFAGADAVVVDGLPPLVNRNELLGSYPDADGVKTGFTSAAGESIAGSATRDGWRLITVVLDSDDRRRDAAAMLDWGFATFDRVVAVQEGVPLGEWRSEGGVASLRAAEDAAATVLAGSDAQARLRLAPQLAETPHAGDRVGVVELVVEGEVLRAGPVIADEVAVSDAGAEADGGLDGPAAALGAALADTLRGLERTAPREQPAVRFDGAPSGD